MPRSARWMSFSGLPLRQHLAPLLLWVGALAVALWLLASKQQRFDVMGIVMPQQRQIIAINSGRLEMLPVRLLDSVTANQPLAVLNDDVVEAQVATARAEITHLQAELIAIQDQVTAENENLKLERDFEYLREARSFATDLEASRLRLLELTTTIEADRISLEGKRLQLERGKKLRQNNDLSAQDLQFIQTEHDSLKAQIAENEKLALQAGKNIQESQKRFDQFKNNHPRCQDIEKALDPLRKAITVQEHLVAELASQRATLVHKSPIDGVVSQLFRQVGETVNPGDLIMMVTAHNSAEIIAYAPENLDQNLREGMQVDLIKPGQPALVVSAQVSKVSPVIEQLPLRLQRNPNIPQFGRPFLVSVPAELALQPGQLVAIRGAY